MERIQEINTDRIAWCSSERNAAADEVAKAAGISSAAFEQVMAGDLGLTYRQLKKLASFFGRGALFFLEPGPIDPDQVHTPEFRTLENQKPDLSPKIKSLIERAERQRRVYLSLREDLNEPVPPVEFPNVEGKRPDVAAAIARKWLGLEAENTFELYRDAIQAKGMLVFRSNGYSGKWQIPKNSPILGFSLYHPQCPLIVVKKQDAETRQTFTLMHELGHLLLHKESSIDDVQDIYATSGHERDANAFAGNLLVPEKFLNLIDDNERPAEVAEYDYWLESYRKAWGVSTEVILRRLLDNDRLPAVRYQAYREWRSSRPSGGGARGNRMYRHREPKHVFGDNYVKTVLEALSNRQITLVKASRYLDNLKVSDLHKLESFYAGY